MNSIHRSVKNSALYLLVVSVIGCAGTVSQEDPDGLIENIKTSVAQAKNNFCPNTYEISESYLALVRSQQDFCKNHIVESKEETNNYHTDRDFFRGMDGLLIKISPFYIFNH